MRQFLKIAEETLKTPSTPTQEVPTPTQQPVVAKSPVDQPEQTSDDKLLTIAQDFYKAAGKQLSPERAKEVADFYKGDYEKMVTDLYKAAGKDITPERIKSIKKHYKLIEDAPVSEIPKEVIDYNSQVDDIEGKIDEFNNITGGFGMESRMAPAGFEEAKRASIKEFSDKKNAVTDSFDFKPITFKEVVNTMGKGRDDTDEVSQTSKLYLEKYTKRMQESLDRYEKNMPQSVKESLDWSTLNGSDKAIAEEWKRRFDILKQQEDLNESTIYKKDEYKRQYNNVAREAKDNGESVRDAVLKKAEELGDTSEWVKNLSNAGQFDQNDTWLGTSVYNTKERIESTLVNTWRGIKEAFDGWDEKSTVYNETFMKEFDQYLDEGVEDSIKKLMLGTNKSKYDGDIRERRVDVDGVKIILDDKAEPIGIRRPDGNMAFNFKENEIEAINKYKSDKDELKNGVYSTFRVGTLGAKGTQVASDMIPIVGTTLITGGAGLPASAGMVLGTYAVTYGDFYEQQFEKTGSVGNATAFASAATAMTSMLEGLGGIEGSIIKNASKKALNQAVIDASEEVAIKNVVNGKTVTSAFMKHLGKQGLEETGIEVAQAFGEAALEIGFNGSTDLSWKELEEIVILTPFATGPISGLTSASDFKNFSIENIKIAAKKKDVFNKLVDDWVGAAKTDEQREKRQKEADFKKGVVEELSQSFTALDELGVIDPKISKSILEKSVEVVKKKQQIDKTKSDQARGVYENDLATLQSEIQALVQEGYDKKETLDQVAERSRIEIAERDARIKEREKAEKAKVKAEALNDVDTTIKALDSMYTGVPNEDQAAVQEISKLADLAGIDGQMLDNGPIAEAYHTAKANNSNPEFVNAVERLLAPKATKVKEFEEVKNDPENIRLNIVPDNDKENLITHSLPTVADFEAIHDEGVIEDEVGEGLTLKLGSLPEQPNEHGEIYTDAVIHDSEGDVKAQFTIYGDTPVEGAVEVAAVVDSSLQKSGLSTTAYRNIAGSTGKPIIPASITRDFSTEKTSSTLSKAAALFWRRLYDKGIAEEVEVTTKDGKVIRTIAILPEGFTSTSTVKRIEDTGVEDSNVESEAFEQEDTVETNMEDGTFVLNRKGTPITYKIGKFNKNKNGDIISVDAIDPIGKVKTIRAKDVVAELVREKIIHENKLIENEITEEELLRATAESGARTFEQLSSDGTEQDTESARREQEFKEGTREDILKQSVNYQGVQGRLLRDADGTFYVLTPDGDTVIVEGGESTATNEELGITKGKNNVELINESIKNANAERTSIRQRLFDLFYEIDKRIPPNSSGAFVDAFREGGSNIAAVASQLVKALKIKISQPTRNAIGEKRLKEAEELSRRLSKLNTQLSTKNVRGLRKAARIQDGKIEAKQIKAERKAKEEAARKRAEATVVEETPAETTTEPVEEVKTEPKNKEPKKESTDVIPDTVWDAYVNTGVVPDAVLQGIANHVQNGTATKMSERQFAIFGNKTAEVNRILSERDAAGDYTRKTSAKATADAMSIIERRNKQIANVLKSIGFTQDKINDTITVFNQVAKRWAKRNNRPIEDFYTEVFKGIEVADLGEGKRGKTIPLDGGYIIQLSSSANVATPVHELAHIFQNFLNNTEKQAVLDWAGTTSWDRKTSEMFANGFTQWLEKSDTIPDLDAFKRFKEWLMDLYDGIINSRAVLPTFTPDLKRLYTSILSHDVEPHTKSSYNEAVGKNNIMLDRMRKEGIQFKKAVFDDVLRKVEVTARKWQRFNYMPRKMKKLAQQAVEDGFTDPIVALEYVNRMTTRMNSDPDYLPSMSVQEAIGYGYALTQMEAAYERVVAKRKKAPRNQDLLQLQDELSRNIQDLAQVLTIARSHAGLQLRIGSHRFTHDLYSPEVMKIQAINKLNRKLDPDEEKQIDRHSKYIQASMKQFKDAAENLDEATRQELMSMAEQLVSEQFKNSPFMKEALKVAKEKTPRQRSVDIKAEFEKLSKMLSEKPDMLLDEKVEGLYDEDTDDTKFFKSLRSFISLIIANDENIDSFEKLSDAMQVFFPTINQDKLLSVLVWTDPAYQKAKAEELAGTAAIIKKESALLDKLRTYLTETYKEVEKNGNKKVYPARLKELERLISQIQTLAATDYTIDNETFIEATIHLDSLQSIYAGLTLEKIDFSSPNLEDMISKVREYETARKLARKDKQLKELEGIIEELHKGTYEGSLSELIPDNPQRYVDERLQIVADKIGINKEVIKTFKDKSNKLEIIKRLGSLLQKGDKGESIRDFNTIYYNIKAELPEITKREVYDAILYKADPKKVEELLKSARSNMNAEVKAIEKLENFLRKEPKKDAPAETRTALQLELEKIVGDVSRFAGIRYENLSDYKVDELKTKLRNIIDNYEGVLNGSITTMSIKDIIEEVGKIKDKELNLELQDRSKRAAEAVKKTIGDVELTDNIFELVPELLPKIITTENQRLKRILSDDIKHERLIRVNKMFNVVKDLVASGGTLNSTELTAITKFLEIEKKSKDMKPELIRLNRQVYLQRAAFNNWLEEKYTATTTARFKAFVNTPRVLTLAADISFVMYQGGHMLFSHPIIAGKAFGKMMTAAFNHNTWQNQLADIQLSPFYTIAIASGLKLVDETSLTLEEELQLTSILERLYLTKFISKHLRRFGERLYSSYMNHLRLNTFIEGLKTLDKTNGGFVGFDENFYGDDLTFTQEHRDVTKKLASHINMHTGSANTFTGHEGFDEGVNALLDSASGIFIAPRLYASVFRSTLAMTGVPDAVKLFSMRAEASASDGNLMKSFYQYRLKNNLRILGGIAGWHIAMLAMFTGILSGLGGDDEEMEDVLQTQLNPYSSQFLKVKSGQRVFAISPFVSYYRFMGRLAFQGFVNDGVMADSFEMSPTMEKKTGFVDHTYDFFRYRWNPLVGGVIDAGILNRDWDNTPISKHSLFSEDFGWALLDRGAAIVKKSTIPIWGQGIWDNIQRKTYDQVLPELAIDFTGINAYTVEAYQDLEVNGYLKEKTFKLSYTGVPKSIDRPEDIKANVKREFAEWLKSELDNGNTPTEAQMRNKNKQLVRQEVQLAR